MARGRQVEIPLKSPHTPGMNVETIAPRSDVRQQVAHRMRFAPEASLLTTPNYTTYVYLPSVMWIYWSTMPDLIITRVSFDTPNIVAGQSFQFSVVVHNQGRANTAHGSAPDWFTVEVYIKDSSFIPLGPPTDPLDHAGGYCSNGSVNCASGTPYPEHVNFFGNLEPGESRETEFTLTFPDSEVYDLYVQVDTTWEADGYTGQPWGQHLEESEDNNVFAIDDVYVPPAQ
jgi:hypothetical protein